MERGALPGDERVLWQGAPSAMGLARHALHLRGLGIYFAAILVFSGAARLARGETLPAIAHALLCLGLLASVPLILLAAFAVLVARTTTYTITERRVMLRFGVAIPRTLTLPFARIDSASALLRPAAAGDVALRLERSTRLNQLLLWPHVRPWTLRAEPALRALPDAAAAAAVLARALAQSAGMPVPVRTDQPQAAAGRPHAQAAA